MVGAVAGVVSILLGRLTAIIERIRHLNDIGEDDRSRAHLKSDLPGLRKRALMLRNATHLARMSVPFSSRWVRNLSRRVCMVARLCNPEANRPSATRLPGAATSLARSQAA